MNKNKEFENEISNNRYGKNNKNERRNNFNSKNNDRKKLFNNSRNNNSRSNNSRNNFRGNKIDSFSKASSGDYFEGIVKIVRKAVPGPVVFSVSDGYLQDRKSVV